jgi:uncharacterized protein (TIGR01777 family)
MSLRIAITGSTGLVGSKLVPFLLSEGHHVTQISRNKEVKGPQTPVIVWNPDAGQIDASALEGFDVVIHLAGTNVGERWDAKYKNSILDSRVKGTRLLCKTLAGLKNKPKVLLSASAVGIYGNHKPEVISDEDSKLGEGFLADVCKQWEAETKPASDAWIRVVHMRIGVVLSKNGGALSKMWMPFQFGIGGVLGSGQQMMSWIALDEIPWIMLFLINSQHINGPVNVTAPHPVSNAVFTKTLGEVIKRPTIFPVPGVAIKLLFGEMGEVLLLGGNYVVPKRLQEMGYKYVYPHLKEALIKAVA